MLTPVLRQLKKRVLRRIQMSSDPEYLYQTITDKITFSCSDDRLYLYDEGGHLISQKNNWNSGSERNNHSQAPRVQNINYLQHALFHQTTAKISGKAGYCAKVHHQVRETGLMLVPTVTNARKLHAEVLVLILLKWTQWVWTVPIEAPLNFSQSTSPHLMV